MSVLTINGRQWVAGLTWITGTSARKLARAARKEETPYVVRMADESAVVPVDDGDTADMPSLAAVLQRAITEPHWTAAVEADEGGRIAIVRVEDGLISSGGEEVLDDMEAARSALKDSGGPLFATAGLQVEGARIISSSMLADTPEVRVELLPDTTIPLGLVFKASTAAALAAAGVAAWLMTDEIMELLYDPPPALAPIALETRVQVAFDGAALVGACARAIETQPAGLPGWELTEVLCEAEFSNREITGAHRDMQGRAGIMLRWALASGHEATIHRKLMSEHVRAWAYGQVAATTAWAFMPLQPVLVKWEGRDKPDFLALRTALDRHVGPWAESLAFKLDRTGDWEVSMEGPAPLERIEAALARIEGIEVLRLRRPGDGNWHVQIRMTQARSIVESAFVRITTPMFPDWYTENDDA